MKTVLSWLSFIINTSLCGVGMVAIYNQFEHKQIPLWAGPVFAFCMILHNSAMNFAYKKGWITDGFLSTAQKARFQNLRIRKQELAAQRETIIAEAKAKL